MQKYTHKQIAEAEASAQKLPNSEYIIADISDESERIVTLAGMKFVIKNPVTLIIRKGGQTHRVVDEFGQVYCYADPSTGKSLVSWKTKTGVPVQF